MNESSNNRKFQKCRQRRCSLRRAMMSAVTDADVFEIMKVQVFLARKGDAIATREVLDRVIGRPASVDAELSVSGNGHDALAPAMYDEQHALEEALAMDATVPALPLESSDLCRQAST